MKIFGVIFAMAIFSVYPALCLAILLAMLFFNKPDTKKA